VPTRKNLSDLLTIPHAAKILGTTRQAVSLAIARKRIKVHKIDHIRLIPRPPWNGIKPPANWADRKRKRPSRKLLTA